MATKAVAENPQKLTVFVVAAISVTNGDAIYGARDDFNDAVDLYATMKGDTEKYQSVRLYKMRANAPQLGSI